jgi:hypothetical protein
MVLSTESSVNCKEHSVLSLASNEESRALWLLLQLDRAEVLGALVIRVWFHASVVDVAEFEALC